MLIVPCPLATLPILWTVYVYQAVALTSGSVLHASPSWREESLLYEVSSLFMFFFPKDLRVEGVATVQNVKHSPAISFANFGYPTKFD